VRYHRSWPLQLIDVQRFVIRKQARVSISEYVEMFGNRQHTQACLGCPSPAALAQRFKLDRTAAWRVGILRFRPTLLGPAIFHLIVEECQASYVTIKR
jgi:hypothetical protein